MEFVRTLDPMPTESTVTLILTHEGIQQLDYNKATAAFMAVADDWATQGKGQLARVIFRCGDCCGPCVSGPEPWKRIAERISDV